MNVNISTETLFDVYKMYKSKLFVLKRRSEKTNANCNTHSLSTRKYDFEIMRGKYLYLHDIMIKTGLLEQNRITRKRINNKNGKQ